MALIITPESTKADMLLKIEQDMLLKIEQQRTEIANLKDDSERWKGESLRLTEKIDRARKALNSG